MGRFGSPNRVTSLGAWEASHDVMTCVSSPLPGCPLVLWSTWDSTRNSQCGALPGDLLTFLPEGLFSQDKF